ncbi:histidine N-acetyltransferase-like [Heterodontus francisci]|uniref:histidine N-acetyltransferase-like n=1 Tax=Heterodontus francisci TaxID=7792 RepID=UPI00355B8B92
MVEDGIHALSPNGRWVGGPSSTWEVYPVKAVVLHYSELDLDFSQATEEDFEQVLSLLVNETDYLPSTYHHWLKERNRMVILAKRNSRVRLLIQGAPDTGMHKPYAHANRDRKEQKKNKVERFEVALVSAHIVDDGQTAAMEALNVHPSERGKGIGRLIYKHILQCIRARYPEVKNQSGVTGQDIFKGFHPRGKQSLISLRFPSINVPTLKSELISNMKKSGAEYWEPISLQPDEVRSVFLNRTVIDTVLPGRRIVHRGGVFKPLESNLDILLKRDISWIADRKENTRAVSLGTAPYRDPMGNYVYRIDMFGKDLSAVKSVFLSQLQNLPPLQGNVICLLPVNPSLSPQMWEFCTKELGLQKGKQYWKDVFIAEGDIFQILTRF